MNHKYNLVIPALFAGLLAACGGNGPTSASGSAPVLAATTGSATSWTSVKWGGGGYVTGLIYHPTSANVLYARTDVGGAYRWNATTSTWTPITDGLGFGAIDGGYHGIESIAVDPTNDQLVYMVGGLDLSSNARLYISSDRGNSWTWVTLPFPAAANNPGRAIGERLKLDPTNPSTMFYASRTAGLWKSVDSGHTWSQVTGLSSTVLTSTQLQNMGGSAVGVEQIMLDNSNVGGGQTTWIMYATIASDYAQAAGLTSTMYKSVDGGSSWTPLTVPAAVSGFYVPHMTRSADGYYYVVFNQNAGPGGGGPGYLYKYGGNNGDTWTLLSSSSVGGYAGVSVYGSGSTTRIALGVANTWGSDPGQTVQLSDNGGSTWREIEASMPHSPTSDYAGWNDDIEIDPNNRDHIMHVTGGGIWETTTASSSTPSWSTKVNNLEETVTLSLVTPPAGASYKFIDSAGDIGTWVQTNLATKPTKGPTTNWSNGNAADMAWSDPTYIAGAGVASWSGAGGFGFWSGDSGNTWTNFATLPTGAQANTGNEGNIVVTSRNNVVWAPANSVPSYTTNNGASWVQTNLPALASLGVNRGYRLAADRRNANKVYAYDSGGAWWGSAGKVYVSTDAGHTFTLSQGSVNANLRANPWGATSMVVNPNVEGDIWLADGNDVYHSLDSGATWTKLNVFTSVWGDRQTWQWPYVQGASAVALGKAKSGSKYSAAVYVVGVINGQWGVYHSDDAGATWARYNDDAHQFGGIGAVAGDWNTYGRIYVAGSGRGVIYTN